MLRLSIEDYGNGYTLLAKRQTHMHTLCNHAQMFVRAAGRFRPL